MANVLAHRGQTLCHLLPVRHYECRLDLPPLLRSLSNHRGERNFSFEGKIVYCTILTESVFLSAFEPIHWPILAWKSAFVAPCKLTTRVKSSFSWVPGLCGMRNDREVTHTHVDGSCWVIFFLKLDRLTLTNWSISLLLLPFSCVTAEIQQEFFFFFLTKNWNIYFNC